MNLINKISSLFGGEKRLSAASAGTFYRFMFGGYRGYRSYSDDKLAELYARNELAFACINKIADVMNDAKLIVEKQNNKGEYEEIKGHPLTALMLKPNSEEIGLDFRKKLVQSEYSLGKYYIRLIRPRPRAVPVAFYFLNPNRVTPQPNYSTGKIEYFQYINPLGHIENIPYEDILIRRRVDFSDEFHGLAPLQVAANTIEGDENLTDYVNSFLDPEGGAGVPAGILKFNKTLSPEQAALKKKLWNKYTQGNEVQVVDENADYQAVASKLGELGVDALRPQNEAKILGIFGVPASLVSAYVGYLHMTQNATVKTAMKDFYLNKISPELKMLREWATWFLLPEFEDESLIRAEKIRVNWDLSQMLALQEDLDATHSRNREDFKSGGITLNEYRAAIGLPADPKGDYYLQPFSLTAISPENRAAEAVRKVEAGTNPDEETAEETPKRFQLKAATAHEFSSTQVDLPAAEKKVILAFGKEFISDDDLADSIDWEPREDKPHITVKFGLHVDDAEDLKELLKDVAPFEVTLRKTSIFPANDKNDYDVVKIDVESDALHALNKLIADNLETTDTHPKYVPHLTLAYVKAGKGKDYVGDETFDGQKLTFDSITFSDKNRNKTKIKLTGKKSQKKTFDFDGLELSREPNEIEKLIGLKSLVSELTEQSESLEKTLLKYRESLINQAVSAAKDLDDKTIFALTLERNEKQAKFINKSLLQSFEIGRKQIIREINAQTNQKSGRSDYELKELAGEPRIATIGDVLMSKMLNEVQSRTINVYTALKLLGFDNLSFFDELKKKVESESTAFVMQSARNGANAAIMTGREVEILAFEEDAETEYSAILDKNVCENCKEWDGKRSKNPDKDLPKVPNNLCLGGSNCRCFWVLILDE